MYNDLFDKEIIDYVLQYFNSEGVRQLNVTSDIVTNNIYEVRFENDDMVLQFYYEKEDKACEAQIRITTILLRGKLVGRGLSKRLINKLVNFCNEHGTMSLWIYELVNQSWEKYLVENGAIVLREESLYGGATLLIPSMIV